MGSQNAVFSAVLEVYGPFPSDSRNERAKQLNLEMYKRRFAARFTVWRLIALWRIDFDRSVSYLYLIHDSIQT